MVRGTGFAKAILGKLLSMWHVILYGYGAVVGFYAKVTLGVDIAGRAISIEDLP
jgi:hypothetical protein